MEDKKNNNEDFVLVDKDGCNPGKDENTSNKIDKEVNKNINIEIEENIIYQEKKELTLLKNFKAYIKYIKNNLSSEEDNKIKETEEKEEQKNILEEYLEDKNVLKNKEKLIAFMEELIVILKSGYNCIIPFLDLCPLLLKEYIESDLDEEEGNTELKYIETFELLKYNTFISRENLCPIYDYFGRLYYLMNTLVESDKKLKKFKKVLELWNIIYTFEPEKYPQIEIFNKKEKKIDINSSQNNTSSFCFLGTGLEFEFNENIFSKYYTRVEIFVNNNIFTELNNDAIILNVKNEKNPIKLTINEIKIELPQNVIIESIDIHISEEIKFMVNYKDINNNKNENFNKVIPIKNKEFILNKLSIFENFFGKIEAINFFKYKIGNEEDKNGDDNNIQYTIKPYLLSDNIPYYDENLIGKFKFINPNLAKVNYINYLEKDFNLIEYFLGVKPMIPFVFLIKGIYGNIKINYLNGVEKMICLRETFLKIIKIFLSILLQYKKKEKKSPIKERKSLKNMSNKKEKESVPSPEIKDEASRKLLKYDLFAISIILQLPIYLTFVRQDTDEQKIQDLSQKIAALSTELFIDLDDYELIFCFNNSTNEEDFYNYLEGANGQDDKIKKKIERDKKNMNTHLLFSCTYKQLYRHLMKELFIYNRLWSIKEVFFLKDNIDNYDEAFNKIKLKYKQISYYTKSLEQPYLYPVLEINEYIPIFSKFKKGELFKHDFKDALSYDFNFNNTRIFGHINDCLAKQELYIIYNNLKFNCCLVKKGYHVKGKLFVIELESETKNREFCIIFQSNDGDIELNCNKKISKKKEKDNKNKNNNLCYGSVFHSPKKEDDRKIILRLKDVNLILIRNYFKSTSAIEIFTTKNHKSYYFNFYEILTEKHPFIKLFNDIQYFQKIKLKFNKYLGRLYNKNQDNILFSFMSDEFFPNSLGKKLNLINRYDLLTLINILSNRSYKDLYQYPVFPILYNPSKILNEENKKERDLSKHLGLQDITPKSIKRMELIKGYDDESDDCECKGKSKENNFIFNIHYSNPTFTGNYLIRIFPYSLTAIEFQGDGFDSPNRQFYCIEKSLENTLSQKSDLREFIPELYYFPDLFFNRNQLKLGTLSTGEEIDDMYIKEKNEDKQKKYDYLKDLKNYLLNDKNLNINSWIDLIFGVNQEKCQELKKNYYSKEKYIHPNIKDQKNEIKIPLNLELVEFGVQPFKMLDSKFPELNKDEENDNIIERNRLMNYKLEEFYTTHLCVKNNKDMCFLFEWDEYLNYKKYISFLYFEDSESYDIKLDNYNKYIFKGNILGDVIITQIKIDTKKSDCSEENIYKSTNFSNTFQEHIFNKKEDPKVYESKKENIKEKNDEEMIIQKLSDHYKQIKYIDYNPRLNIFLSYGLDGYINIYIFPTCKLIRTIKVKDITKSDDVLIKLALISNPYPMLFFHDVNYIYILSINGDLINKKEMQKNKTVIPCIDKILGLSSDSINEFIYLEEKKSIEMKGFDLPTFNPNDN